MVAFPCMHVSDAHDGGNVGVHTCRHTYVCGPTCVHVLGQSPWVRWVLIPPCLPEGLGGSQVR